MPARVRAWDLPTRLFHWTLLILVVSAWVSYRFAEDLGDVTLAWHRANGLALLTLLAWRVLWGVCGSPTARFVSFVHGPRDALRYAHSLVSGLAPRYVGHNPLGAFMVIALLATLAVQASFGLFAVDENDLTGGPLHRLVGEAAREWATGWHDRIFHFVLLPLIGLHVVANVLYAAVKREPLITAMVTGQKPAADYADADRGTEPPASNVRALACLLAAAALVGGTIWLLGGRW